MQQYDGHKFLPGLKNNFFPIEKRTFYQILYQYIHFNILFEAEIELNCEISQAILYSIISYLSMQYSRKRVQK